MTPLVVATLLVLEPFLAAWIGADLAAVGTPVGVLLLAGFWINGLAYVPFVLLQAQGRPDVPAKLHLLELPPYLVALWAGLSAAGVAGAAAAWTLRVTADALLLFAASRIPWREQARLGLPGLVVALAAVGALALFSDPVARVSLGGALVLLSVAAGWQAAPPPLRRVLRTRPRAALGRG